MPGESLVSPLADLRVLALECPVVYGVDVCPAKITLWAFHLVSIPDQSRDVPKAPCEKDSSSCLLARGKGEVSERSVLVW